jgi:RNA polymerase sigma-70 factor, ECF subfamily
MATRTDVWEGMLAALRRYMRRRVRDEHLVDDLAQDVLLKAQKGLATAPTDDKLAAWMFQIARNTVIDFYRSRRSDAAAHRAPEPVEDVLSPEAETEAASALTGCLRPMIQRLPEPYREALELTEYEGLTQQALAERLGISISGAKSRVQRGREKLKGMLLDCCRIEHRTGRGVVDVERTERSDSYCDDEDPTGDVCS